MSERRNHGAAFTVRVAREAVPEERRVPACRIPNTRQAGFRAEAPHAAIHRFGPPWTMNTDHASRFTSFAWTGRPKRTGTQIPSDGTGRCPGRIVASRTFGSSGACGGP